MVEDLRAPFRQQFDNARDPYTARNALGITSTGGGGGAPTNAEYIVAATDPTLTNERVLTNTATVTWDFSTAGQAKATATGGGGGGNVSNSGTPTVGQYAKWVTSTTIQGVSPATVLSDIGAQPAGSYLTIAAAAAAYQPLDADLTAIAALTGTNTIYYRSASNVWSPVVVSTGLAFSGGNLTCTVSTAGFQPLDATLTALAAYNTNGLLTQTAADTFTGRTLTGPAAGITVSNGNGVSGNPTLALANDLAALEALTGTNTIPYRSGADSWADVTIGTGLTFTGGTLAATGGGGGSTLAPPGGRLTLTTNTPVMIANATAQSTIYYSPFVSQLVPSYGGSSTTMVDTGGQKSLALDSNAAHTGYHQSGKLFDVFWDDAGARLVTGPAWTSDTARSAALALKNGFWTNNASMTARFDTTASTVTIAANRGLYLGTFWATANGQTGMNFNPAAASGGTANILGVYNAYNRVTMTAICREGVSSYTYGTTTWRAQNGSSSNCISYIDGLASSVVLGSLTATPSNSVAAGHVAVGVNRDSTSATPDLQGIAQPGANSVMVAVHFNFLPSLGYHTISAVEYSTITTTFYCTGWSASIPQTQGLILEIEI